MLRVDSIVIRVDDLRRQAEFWKAALDYVPGEGDALAEPEGNRFCVVGASQ